MNNYLKPRIFKVDTKRYPNHPKPWTLVFDRCGKCETIRTYKTWRECVDYLIWLGNLK